AHLGEEEGYQGGKERAEALEVGLLVIVQLVRNQRPHRHGGEAGGEYPAQGGGREETGDPVTDGAGGEVVGQGGEHYAPDDRPGAAEAGGQEQGEQLRLVADFGEGDDSGGNQQGFEHQAFLRGGFDCAMTRTTSPPRVAVCVS